MLSTKYTRGLVVFRCKFGGFSGGAPFRPHQAKGERNIIKLLQVILTTWAVWISKRVRGKVKASNRANKRASDRASKSTRAHTTQGSHLSAGTSGTSCSSPPLVFCGKLPVYECPRGRMRAWKQMVEADGFLLVKVVAVADGCGCGWGGGSTATGA